MLLGLEDDENNIETSFHMIIIEKRIDKKWIYETTLVSGINPTTFSVFFKCGKLEINYDWQVFVL